MSPIQVLVIVLNEVDYLEEILAGFVEIGVSGATILDSQGMASAIVRGDNNQSISLFGALKTLLEDAHPYNKTIFTVLENEGLVNKAVAVVNEVVGDITSPGVGFMFSVPINMVFPMGLSN